MKTSARFRINLVRGDNAVLSGIFFDPASTPSTGVINPRVENRNANNPFEHIYLTSKSVDFSFTTHNANDLVEATLFDSVGRKVCTPLKGNFTGQQRVISPLPGLLQGVYVLQAKVNDQCVLSEKCLINNQ